MHSRTWHQRRLSYDAPTVSSAQKANTRRGAYMPVSRSLSDPAPEPAVSKAIEEKYTRLTQAYTNFLNDVKAASTFRQNSENLSDTLGSLGDYFATKSNSVDQRSAKYHHNKRFHVVTEKGNELFDKMEDLRETWTKLEEEHSSIDPGNTRLVGALEEARGEASSSYQRLLNVVSS